MNLIEKEIKKELQREYRYVLLILSPKILSFIGIFFFSSFILVFMFSIVFVTLPVYWSQQYIRYLYYLKKFISEERYTDFYVDVVKETLKEMYGAKGEHVDASYFKTKNREVKLVHRLYEIIKKEAENPYNQDDPFFQYYKENNINI